MDDPEDRPTDGSWPAPHTDPADRQPVSPSPGAPGGPPAGEPVTSFTTPPPAPPPSRPADPAEPHARWEDVVDPKPIEPVDVPESEPQPPTPPPATDAWPEPGRLRQAPPAQATTAAAATTAARADDELDDQYDDDYDDEPASRWVSLLATIGTALIGIVTVQVLTSLVEAFTLKSGQRVGVPDDLFHRLGYPFGGLGATALVFLVLGVVLVSMPSVLDELLSESQERVVGIALVVAIVLGVVIAIGSLLAVRANLHEYAAKNVPVPTYVRVQFTNFLLGALGAAALTLFGAIAAINERSRERSSL